MIVLITFRILMLVSLLSLFVSINYATMERNSKIYVAGHRGLVGSALLNKLKQENFTNIITKTSQELDLRDQKAVQNFFETELPEYVFLAAAHVGGIYANDTYPAQFLYDNLMIATNVIHSAYLTGVKKLICLGSSCIYPRECPQPIKEEYLLTSPLEKTNEAYALAKIIGLKLCQTYNRQYGTKFISCMPTNLYGENDTFHLENSHVIPALIMKICQAQQEGKEEVVCWGTGKVRREFLHVRDLADAVVYLMDNYEDYNENSWINIGTGEDITIEELVMLIKKIAGFEGKIVFDKDKPEGTPRKLLDVSRINQLGWKAKITLEQGLKEAIKWYRNNNSRF